eukprot:522829-Alexandrium_andersonii.AAC.1
MPPVHRHCFSPSIVFHSRFCLAGNDCGDSGRPGPVLTRRHLRGSTASGVASRVDVQGNKAVVTEG